MNRCVLFLFYIFNIMVAGEESISLPEFDQLFIRAGKPIHWQKGADGRYRFLPAPNGAAEGVPFLPLPTDNNSKSPVRTLLSGGSWALPGFLLCGGRDLASLGDAATHARRLGWEVTEVALKSRINDLSSNPTDRLLAFRLLEVRYPSAAAELAKALATDKDLHLRHAAKAIAAPELDDLPALQPNSSAIRVVYRPSLYPPQTGGVAAGRNYGILGVMQVLDRGKDASIDPEWLIDSAQEIDALGELPIAFADYYGNIRIDRVVAWLIPGADAPTWELQVRGAGGEAAGKALEAWFGASRPTLAGKSWQTERWWASIHGDSELRVGTGMETVKQPIEKVGLRWQQPDASSALCISVGVNALADAPRLLDIYTIDQDGNRIYPKSPLALTDLLHGDQTANLDVWFDGVDTQWKISALGVDEQHMMKLRDWLEDWLPSLPHVTNWLVRQPDGRLSRIERNGTEFSLHYITRGAPLRDAYSHLHESLNIMAPDWPAMLERITAKMKTP